MRADDYSELVPLDSEGRPQLRKKALSTITAEWAAGQGIPFHPYVKAAYEAAAAANATPKPSPSARASLLREWRACMEALGAELANGHEHPTLAMAKAHVEAVIEDGTNGLDRAEVALYDMVLRPGSPWRR